MLLLNECILPVVLAVQKKLLNSAIFLDHTTPLEGYTLIG